MRAVALLAFPAAFAVVGAGASWACSALTGPSFPPGAQPVPASFATVGVDGLPTACSGQVYFVATTSLCPPGLTYFLCDGSSYTEYDCSAPGPGWTEEKLSQYDRLGTDPGPCSSNTGPGPRGTIYVESSLAAPAQNEILVFSYCAGTLPSTLLGRYSTGGTGATDFYARGYLDADQQVVFDAAHRLLFAVNQGSDTIAVFHVGADGLLTPVTGSPFPSGGKAPGSVGVSGDLLIVANKAADGVRELGAVAPNYTTFFIQADGSLKPAGSPLRLSPGASPTQAFVPPGGGLVFGTEERGCEVPPPDALSHACDQGDGGLRDGGSGDGGSRDGGFRDGGHRDGGHRDGGHRDSGSEDSGEKEAGPEEAGRATGCVRALQLSPAGELTTAPGSPFPLPNVLFRFGPPTTVWPAGLSAQPGQPIVYTGVPNNNSIAAFRYTSSGEMCLLGGTSDLNTVRPSLPCWSIVSADGRRLYFANAGSDNISIWDTSQDAGRPPLVQTYQLPGGGNPWGLHMDATGTLLFVITPRQVQKVPEGQGQLLHALQLAGDGSGTVAYQLPGSPVLLPVPPGTNVYGLAVVAE